MTPELSTYRVVAVPNPFREERVIFDCPCNKSIAGAIQEIELKNGFATSYTAWIGPHEISSENFNRIYPNGGTTLYLKATLHLPVTAALATALGGTLLAKVAASIIVAVITSALSFLVNMLFAPSPPEISSPDRPNEATVYDIRGARNRPKRYGVVPRPLGKTRYVPPYGANPYTEIVGKDQYLRMMVVWGYGPLRVTDIKVGDTLLSSYDDYEIETIPGDPGTDVDSVLYPNVARQEDLSIELSLDENGAGSFTERTTPIDTDEIGVTLTWRQGLLYITDRGDYATNNIQITIEYRSTSAASGDPWTSLTNAENVSAKTAQPYRKSWRVAVARDAYDVRIKADNPSQSDDGSRYIPTWTALRSFQNADPVTLPGLCYSVIRVRATDQLNGVLDQINGIVEAEIPMYDPTADDWDTVGYSRNPADIFRFVLTSGQNAKALSAAAVDDTRLAEWWSYCDANSYTFGHVIDYETSVRDLLVQIAQAGRASVSVVDGLWGVVIDNAKSTVTQHFTPRNSWGFTGSRLFPDQPHALRVRFVNEDAEYQVDERIVYDDGYTSANATLFESMELTGVQNADHAYKLAREYLAIVRLRPELFEFQTDLEHLICVRGDRIRLSHDVPKIGTAFGRVKSVTVTGSDQELTLDQEVTMADALDHVVRFRLADGTDVLRNVLYVPGTTTTIGLNPADIDTTAPEVGDLFMFGVLGSETLDLIVHAIDPADDMNATITALPYAPEVFDAATSIPSYTSVLSAGSTRAYQGPTTPIIDEIISDETVLRQTANGEFVPTILVQFRPGAVDPAASGYRSTTTTAYRVRWREYNTDVDFQYSPLLTDTTSWLIDDVIVGQGYDIGVQAIDAAGATSQWRTETNHIVTGTSNPPTAIDSLLVKNIGPFTYAEWVYSSPPVDLVNFELRYHPDPDVTNWSQMTPLGPLLPRLVRSFAVPTRNGTYAIKPVDVNGARSLTAVYANSTVEDPEIYNTLQTETEDPSFAGTKTTTTVDGSTLKILANLDGTYPSLGYYEFQNEVDLGIVTTTRVSPSITAGVDANLGFMSGWTTLASVATLGGNVDPDQVNVEFQVAFSLDDNSTPVYGDWKALSATGEYTARHLKFRVKLSSLEENVTPTITALSVDVEAPNIYQTGDDIAIGTAAAYAVTFSPAFYALKSVTVTPQDMATGDYFTVTSKSRTGFTVSFFDSSNNPLDRTFDYVAVGYGRERGT